MARNIGDLPHALEDGDGLSRRLSGKTPAVFLDYDGTLTPICDRPQDALISESMREAYRGHIFWDELYIYPFLNFRLPEITRELLMYRYRRIAQCRRAPYLHPVMDSNEIARDAIEGGP